jgi:hypothetical protein
MNIVPKLVFGLTTSILLTTAFVDKNVSAQSISDFIGRWTVAKHSSTGSSVDHWDITIIHKNQLSIVSFREDVPGIPLPGDYRNPLFIEQVNYNNASIYLKLRRGSSITTEYTLTFIRRDRLEGQWRTVDTTLIDQGIIGGQAGIVQSAGKIIMTRER